MEGVELLDLRNGMRVAVRFTTTPHRGMRIHNQGKRTQYQPLTCRIVKPI